MRYQPGELVNPKEDDPTFNTYSEAFKHVQSKSDLSPQGIWTGQEDGSELVAIIWEGMAYRQ